MRFEDYELVILEAMEAANLPGFFSDGTIAPPKAFKLLVDAGLLEGIASERRTPGEFKIRISAITPLGFIRLRELRAGKPTPTNPATPAAKPKLIVRATHITWKLIVGIILVLGGFWQAYDHRNEIRAAIHAFANRLHPRPTPIPPTQPTPK